MKRTSSLHQLAFPHTGHPHQAQSSLPHQFPSWISTRQRIPLLWLLVNVRKPEPSVNLTRIPVYVDRTGSATRSFDSTPLSPLKRHSAAPSRTHQGLLPFRFERVATDRAFKVMLGGDKQMARSLRQMPKHQAFQLLPHNKKEPYLPSQRTNDAFQRILILRGKLISR